MKPLPLVVTVLMIPLLAACATDRYWYESPPPDQQVVPSLAGTWQGLARHDYVQRYNFGTIAGHVKIRCAAYQDLVRLEVSGGQLKGALGSDPVFRFTTPIGPGGDFRHQMAVSGDTWIYGGVSIYSNEPTLTITGNLDPYSGTGGGTIAVTPGARERLGCYGRFHVSRNAGPPRPEQLGPAFRIQYWIDRVEGSENNRHRMILH